MVKRYTGLEFDPEWQRTDRVTLNLRPESLTIEAKPSYYRNALELTLSCRVVIQKSEIDKLCPVSEENKEQN